MKELRAALELATEEELQQLTHLLFQRKLNPLDYVYTPDPLDVQSQDRDLWIEAIANRFQFLAADGLTVLRGQTQQITYRQVLIQVCRYLRLPYQNSLSTTELEAEIFLHLIRRSWKRLPASEKRGLKARISKALAESNFAQPLPLSAQKDPIGVFLKGGFAFAVNSAIKPLLIGKFARQFALHFASYQATKQVLVRGSVAATAKLHSQVILHRSSVGMAANATRYGVARTVFSVLGPALWAWFFADLGWRAIATNYTRIIPTIFALAQIRLTRSACWEPA
ncbi:YaaW family protein [Roseofilum casamattae]|uniref:Uncharacterized protein n=1 Tax=Roseofilum casamattae BLCC-M143 TaxID=3022442 RepID=A0ABT7BRG2_9CYAN|nr:hypothetical protein [Roseofilum casamattae]MDJ1181766.1 hypothetical protein [Roseofilum casamattae BLCC-M143]